MPGGASPPSPLSLVAAEGARERKLPQTRRQDPGFRRPRAGSPRAAIINSGAETRVPGEKDEMDFGSKRCPAAAQGQPPSGAVTVDFRNRRAGSLSPRSETLDLLLSFPRPPPRSLSRIASGGAGQPGRGVPRCGRGLRSALPHKGACSRQGRAAGGGGGGRRSPGGGHLSRSRRRAVAESGCKPQPLGDLSPPPGPRLPASPPARVNTELRSIWAI
ncbi:translation initiation factor IF-2-like isoform X1 [Falco biarmicus]|uniref:translation initiation factor IF-2-like isoform X1 n=1 Tax=Falco biarmicus TaxID=345155 RepID=UPI0024BD10B4|nr:translation initiation factor IF-2-like isoform X1 [Falco biarmicus]